VESIPAPVIAVAEAGNERLAVEALKAGAVDYLPIDSGFPESVSQVVEEILWEDGLHPSQINDGSIVTAPESHEAIKAAAATLSHEINNPLMTILGTAELIMSDADNLDKSTIDKARVILSSARRIDKKLRMLSDLTQSTVAKPLRGG